ncbi:MAG: IPT/TIG domain-containing protein [Caldilineaceae bacterium]|nr:IPT/TIG domain-containing protein [Caldilineaceae bacterium]
MKRQPLSIDCSVDRVWRWVLPCALLIVGVCLSLAGGVARASTPVDYGYRTFSYANGSSSGCNSTPTGEKPESKLWYNDGLWWGSLCHGPSKSYHIYQFDLVNQDWIDTGTEIDNRGGAKADVLWDEAAQKLYVASAVFTNSGAASSSQSNWARLYRYSYNSGSKRYTLDSGFPVVGISRGRSETITLTKDSTGMLWVTYVEDRKVMLNHSRNGNDADWGAPYVLPATGASNVSSDDISSMISFGDRVGVLWSNQSTKIMYFAVHQATDANDLNWQSTNVYNPGGSGADDHINLKALQNDPAGVIFAATKTSFTGSQPLINLLVCTTFPCTSAAQWQVHMLYTGSENDTRPIVQIDTAGRKLHFFTTGSGSGGDIRYKVTSLDNIQFARGEGELFIKKSDDLKVNNATSTKQYVNGTTGLLVAAGSQTTFYYYHNYISLNGGPPPTPPVISSFSPTSGAAGSEVTITGSRFTGANAVAFNGTAATFVVDSNTQIRATVPANATSGPIRVTTPQGSATSATNFTVIPPNQAPSVNAGADQAVNLPNTVLLAAAVSDDGLPTPPGTVTLQWSKASGPGNVTFGSPTAANTTASFSASGTYVLRLTANDGELDGWDEATVKVNQPPSVNAGADQSVTLPAGAALAATVSDDGLPNPPGALTLQWSKASGPGDVTFENAAAANTSASFSAAGVYVLRISASDGSAGNMDELTVTVNPAAPSNQPPSVNAGPDQTITSPAQALLSGTASDDGLPNPPGVVALQWSKVDGPGDVTFDSPNTGATAAGFTATGEYVLRLTADDGALSAWDEVTVTVNPAAPTNQAPSVNAGADQTVTLPDSVTLAATVSDDGLPNGTLTLQWSKTSGPGNVTFVDAAAANTTAGFSAAGEYVLRLTAGDGEQSAWDEVAVTVNDPNTTPTAPVITSFSPAGGAEGDTVTVSGSGFSGATSVKFNGTEATFVVESDSQIRTTVPAGATSGPLSVTTPQGSAASAASFTVETPPPDAEDVVFVSLASSATVAGMDVRDEDILAYDTGSDQWTLIFDGSDVGLSASDINAFELLDDNSMLLSLNTIADLGKYGLTDRPATPIDILRFIPESLGSNTRGRFEWVFQGGSLGLENTTSEVIDALALTPEGDLLLSLAGSYDLPGVSNGRDEDLIRFTPSQRGDFSSGTFSLYFDGSDVGLSESADEDVVGVWRDLDSPVDELYLTTKGLYNVSGLSGDGADIFICTPGSLGSTTSCTFRSYWEGSKHGLTGEIVDAFSIDKGGRLFRTMVSALQQLGGQSTPQAPEPIEEDDGWPDTDNWVSFPYLLDEGPK